MIEKEKIVPEISIVIPLFNEEEVFTLLLQRLVAIKEKTSWPLEVILVDDGSQDSTPFLISQAATDYDGVKGVLLSRNFGHQIAVSAGLDQATATKAVMVIDGDLQDPPELIFQFYELLGSGYDVVFGVRKKRKETWVKKMSYFLFYRLLNAISNISMPLDSGDFCMMSRKVVDQINSMPERSRYLRGMRSWVGFKQIKFEYERDERASGNSKYSFKMLFQLAYNGIYNFSDFPIKLIYRIGAMGLMVSVAYFIYLLYLIYFLTEAPEGFVTIVFFILLFGSLNLLALGIIGEYIVRIFFETKKRPLYIIDSIVE